MRPRLRLLALGLLCVAGVAAGFAVWTSPSTAPPRSITQNHGAPIGDAVHLVDHDGRPVVLGGFAGKARLVFFGFTHCPDVCPTGLSLISLLLEGLGPRAGEVQALFITVDPERDTPEVIKGYIENFPGGIIGLTGSSRQIETAVAAFSAYHKKVPQPSGGYMVDHTASIFLLDRQSRFRSTIDLHEPPDVARRKILAVLDSARGGG
jgi:protein SCO1